MNYADFSLAHLVNISTSKKLSAGLIVLGTLAFLLTFFQLPGAVLLLIGSGINLASNRTQLQKLLWLLPITGCVAVIVRILLSP